MDMLVPPRTPAVEDLKEHFAIIRSGPLVIRWS